MRIHSHHAKANAKVKKIKELAKDQRKNVQTSRTVSLSRSLSLGVNRPLEITYFDKFILFSYDQFVFMNLI